VLCCVVLCCVVLCCVVLCCVVLRCVVLCYVVLCCVVLCCLSADIFSKVCERLAGLCCEVLCCEVSCFFFLIAYLLMNRSTFIEGGSLQWHIDGAFCNDKLPPRVSVMRFVLWDHFAHTMCSCLVSRLRLSLSLSLWLSL
jgi:hypothetical protein